MWKAVVAAAFLLAGCALEPVSDADVQAQRFEPMPDKAVIYIVRDHVGADVEHMLKLDDSEWITTYTGRYYRWEVAPGTHRISGAMESTASLALAVEAGKIYFVRHVVVGSESSDGALSTHLHRVDERIGRATVARGRLL